MSKSEMEAYWLKKMSKNEINYSYRKAFDSAVIAKIDSLKQRNIDTIAAYREQCYGCIVIDTKPCQSGPGLNITYLQWIRNGITYLQKFEGTCHFKTIQLDSSALILFYSKNKNKLDHEVIFPLVEAMHKDKKGKVQYEIGYITDGSDYTIYCDLKGHSKLVQYSDFDIYSKEGLFHTDNMKSLIVKWRKEIERQTDRVDSVNSVGK